MIGNEIWLGGNGRNTEKSSLLLRLVDPSYFLLKLVIFDKEQRESFIIEQGPYEYSFDPLDPPRYVVNKQRKMMIIRTKATGLDESQNIDGKEEGIWLVFRDPKWKVDFKILCYFVAPHSAR
jgi:hypothetical protein